MVFQPKGGRPPGGSSNKSNEDSSPNSSIDSLVDQIAEAVRERLLKEGVPLPPIAKSAQISPSGFVPSGAKTSAAGGQSVPSSSNENTSLASKIDHTLLKPDATREEIERLCEEARKHSFATVCVNSAYVGLAAQFLKGCVTKAIAVVGFPLGAATTTAKAFEAREAINAGAQEIDMVINIGALKGRDYSLVQEDIRQVVEASKPYPVKVILETSSLTEDQKIIGCALSKAAGAAFVKTSTGFGSGGATVEDVALMRRIVGPEMGVKASGGVRTYDDAIKMIAAGANRIGASSSVAIVTAQVGGGATSPTEKKGSGETPAKKGPKNSLY